MLTKAGRYQIVDELGRGAMGVVYRGFDPTIGRSVAIKTIQLETGDPGLLMRLRREAQAAGILSHPNIVTIYDAGEDQGMFYIAMEFVEGTTLQELMTGGPIPLEQGISVVEQVGEALDHAHAREIIHRDIKPANIMIAGKMAKVMDFGVAKISTLAVTTTGQILGTPSYMSPELVKGLLVDGRSDIFSLGVVLYEMLSGTKPFTGDTITTVIYKIIEKDPEPPSAFNSELHPGLNYVVLKALAKDPAERYQSGAELAADLRNYQALGEKGRQVSRRAAFELSETMAVDRAALAAMKEQVAVPKPPAAAAPKAPPVAAARAPAPPATTVPVKKGGRAKAILAVAGVAVVLLAGGVLLRKRSPATEPSQAPPKVAAQLPPKTEPPSPPPAAQEAPPASEKAAGPAEARPAEAPVPPVQLTVNANVEKATIRVDGRTRPNWLTPGRIAVLPGPHRIEVSKLGYQAQSRRIEVKPDGPREIKFELTRLVSTVEIVTNPAGAEVLVDGTSQSARTPGQYTFSYGEHRVLIRKPGYVAHERTVQVSENSPPRMQVELQPERPATPEPARASAPGGTSAMGGGRLVIRSRPPGARIMVDGKPTPYRTPVNIVLPAGPHKITLEYEGFETVTHDATVLAEKIVPLEVKLNPSGKRRRFPLFR